MARRIVATEYVTLDGCRDEPGTWSMPFFSDEAGVGTVPILVVYLIANIALPLWVLATNRAAFRPVKHVLIPLAGSAVLVYGVWEFVQPSQPPPANVFWAWILAIVGISAAS